MKKINKTDLSTRLIFALLIYACIWFEIHQRKKADLLIAKNQTETIKNQIEIVKNQKIMVDFISGNKNGRTGRKAESIK
jgi:hypothetical protein